MDDSITITGNITEPELRHLPSGVAVLGFKVGRSHRTFDKAQQKWVESSTSWYSVSAFRGLAEHAFASLHRGDRVVVHGRLKLKEWENASGVRGFAAEIEAESLGHDLLFGTSSFAKAGGASMSSQTWAPADAVVVPDESRPDTPDANQHARELALAGPGIDIGDVPF